MKNSPGSMIGGIGLTTCVRDVQFSRTMPMTSSTSVLLDAEHDRRVRLLEEPAGAVQPRRAELLLEQGVDERAGVLVVDDRRRRASSRGVSAPTVPPGQRRLVRHDLGRCTMRAPDSHPRAGVDRDQRRTVPRSPSPPARRHRGGRDRRRPRCGARAPSLPPVSRRSGRRWARSSSGPGPPRSASSAASVGLDDAAATAPRPRPPGPGAPVPRGRHQPGGRVRPAGDRCDRRDRSSAPTCR